MEVIYLITYDIADDRRREAVSVLLSSSGARVQLSVFECDLPDSAALQHLTSRLRALIDRVEDQVRVYPLPAGSTRSAEIIGSRTLEERADFWIV